MSGGVGLVVNPHAGKDVRRLVTHASPTSDAAKIGIVRRAAIGAIEGGATEIVAVPDAKHLTRRAIEGLDSEVRVTWIDMPVHGRSVDTIRAAQELEQHGVDVVIALGGDGTSRDIAKGWRDAPLIAVSTGTNNVFPRLIESTVAGVAAGAIASQKIALADAAHRSDAIHVALSDGRSDLALVDVALLAERFVGSRAVWDPSTLRELIVAMSEPASVGLSAIAAALLPASRRCVGGVSMSFAPSANNASIVRAAIAPGTFADLHVASARRIDAETIVWHGPGVLSFDGERDVVLTDHDTAELAIRRDGPLVIDIERALSLLPTAASNEGVLHGH
jgi:predicted polyphosphate/ATP-dependent NAD kinase